MCVYVCAVSVHARVLEEARVHCRVFKHPFQLIHVFILNDPVLRRTETMTYLPQRELKEEKGKRGEGGWGDEMMDQMGRGGVVVEQEGMKDDGKVEMEREREGCMGSGKYGEIAQEKEESQRMVYVCVSECVCLRWRGVI